jgi:hypothetical protein
MPVVAEKGSDLDTQEMRTCFSAGFSLTDQGWLMLHSPGRPGWGLAVRRRLRGGSRLLPRVTWNGEAAGGRVHRHII